MLTSNKDLRRLLDEAQRCGWRFRKGEGHIFGYSPDGVSTTTISVSPSNRHALKRIRRDLGLNH